MDQFRVQNEGSGPDGLQADFVWHEDLVNVRLILILAAWVGIAFLDCSGAQLSFRWTNTATQYEGMFMSDFKYIKYVQAVPYGDDSRSLMVIT